MSALRVLPILVCAALACACGSSPKPVSTSAPSKPPAPASSPSIALMKVLPNPQGAAILDAAGYTGTFVVYDANANQLSATHAGLVDEPFIPASTFKIPSSLIALDLGVIPDKTFSLKWDGVSRSLPDWNRDHDLTSAMKYSVVWYYQEVARRIGAQRMQEMIKKFAYGNQNISGGIDMFWLDGALRISARGQVEFLDRLRRRQLPVSTRAMDIVDDITTLDASSGWTWRGKTGTQVPDGQAGVAWLVGSAQRDAQAWVYALVIAVPKGSPAPSVVDRKALVRRLLAEKGALPPS